MDNVNHDKEVWQQTSVVVAEAEYRKLTYFTFSMKWREQIKNKVSLWALNAHSKGHSSSANFHHWNILKKHHQLGTKVSNAWHYGGILIPTDFLFCPCPNFINARILKTMKFIHPPNSVLLMISTMTSNIEELNHVIMVAGQSERGPWNNSRIFEHAKFHFRKYITNPM